MSTRTTIIDPCDNEVYTSTSPVYQSLEDNNAFLNISGTIFSDQYTICLPGKFVEDTLHVLAHDILSGSREEQDEDVMGRLSKLWDSQFARLSFTPAGQLEYNGDTTPKEELPMKDSWSPDGEDFALLELHAENYPARYEPISAYCRRIIKVPEEESLKFWSNAKVAFNPETDGYEVHVREETGLGSTGVRRPLRWEDEPEVTESCRSTVKSCFSDPVMRSQILHGGQTLAFVQKVDEGGQRVLDSKTLRYSDFDRGKSTMQPQDLGECGQNRMTALQESLVQCAKDTLAIRLVPPRPGSRALQNQHLWKKSTCNDLIDQLVTRRPGQTSTAQWSETMGRAVIVTLRTLNAMTVLTFEKDEYKTSVEVRFSPYDQPSLDSSFSEGNPLSVSHIAMMRTPESEDARLIMINLHFSAPEGQSGELSDTESICLTVKGGPQSAASHLTENGWIPIGV